MKPNTGIIALSTLLDDTGVRRRRQAAVALTLWAAWYVAIGCCTHARST